MIKKLTLLLIINLSLYSSQVIWDGKNMILDNKTFKFYTDKDYLKKVNWNKANSYCENLISPSSLDWYLPTKKQLQLIYSSKNMSDSYKLDYYWSSTTDYTDSNYAWTISFNYGEVASYRKLADAHIICVKNKQEFSQNNKINETSDIQEIIIFNPQANDEILSLYTNKENISVLTNYFVSKAFTILEPKYLKKPNKPTINNAKNILKGRFEKTITFKKRVKEIKQKREKYITKIENKYKKEILTYNKKNKELIDKYNVKVKKLKNNLNEITANSMAKAYNIVHGKPNLKAIDYDADNEMFYGEITSSKGTFSEKIAIKIPIDKAERFFDSAKNPKVIYEYKNGKIYLKEIQVSFESKNYLAMLTNSNFKSSDIKVAINTRDLNLKKATLLNSTFKANKQEFDIGKINYGKSKVAKLNSKDLEVLNKQRLKQIRESTENLASLLNDSKKVKKNQKAYAVVFGIEDYLLESNVNDSQNSAMMFMQYANKLLGVPDDNIWAFVGDRKTSSGFIKSQWDDFLSLVEDDATIYFYYSGHGVPGDDGNAYILPSDTNAETATNDKTFMLKNIYSNLSKTKAKKVVAFVDSCFSGKDDKGSLLFDGVAPVLKVKKTTFDKSKMTIFTAGSSKNFSNQYKEKKHRLFSYYLMKGLALGKSDTKELFKYVKKNVANKSRKLGVAYKQIPELMGKSDGKIR